VEGLGLNPAFWRNRPVFLTGHTGFKGGWLSLWLSHLGAKVYGFALEPPTSPSFFNEVQLESYLAVSTIGDIRDLASVSGVMRQARPNVVFHLAAQPLVRESYASPVETFATNVLGTVNVLESARRTEGVQAIVNVTTDKCYENKEWLWPYRETDNLGGHDPYSSSKACAEIATAAYRKSFLAETDIHVATARAGNVIGGGDWANDRLIPDFFRALDRGETLRVRSPNAVRPWQHVLEPLAGYLLLAEKLVIEGSPFAEAWNFAPEDTDAKSVSWIVDRLCASASNGKWERDLGTQPHEAALLKLDNSKAKANLGWFPRWGLPTALEKTIEWHRHWKAGESMADLTTRQIQAYQAA
jgi:CDP-glucose 4,6-dehydratase